MSTPDEQLAKLTAVSTSSTESEAFVDREAPAELPESVPASAPSSAGDKLDAPAELRREPVLINLIVERYEGERCGELFHGEGVAEFQGGHVYKGHFAHGLMHGHGEYTWADGVKYEGEFVSNAPVGHGIYTWLDSSTYEGEVWYGIRHGFGTHQCAKTSSVYRGQWHQGKRHGKGIICYNRERTSWYEGDWKNNCREGWGVRCYPSGNIYQGQWKNGVRHGEGTMRWIQLSQQYSGQWVAGVQHGQGTHTWVLRRGLVSQYPRSNEYKGEFVQGMRHGQGTFLYASGAVYSGGWQQNKKHGQGKFVFKNGRTFEGEFIEDRMAEFPEFSIDGAKTPDLSGIRTNSPIPDGGVLPRRARKSGGTASVLSTDIVLNIETLLKQIPEAQRQQELRQVEFAIIRHIALLRAIYRFYGSLGHDYSPDNPFLLTRLQFWRFLKDCDVHLHGLTLAQIDRLIEDDVLSEDVDAPFRTVLLTKCLGDIVIAAYHIYHRDIGTPRNVLAECFSKLMKENIIPNAMNVKGPIFYHPLKADGGKKYVGRCWEIFQAFCITANSALSDQTMTARHFIWMFKTLGLFDSELTTAGVLEILSLGNPAIYSPAHSNLDLEINFLEFFEALLYCAEVKMIHQARNTEHGQSELVCQNETVTRSRGEIRDSPPLSQQASSQSVKSSAIIISSAPCSPKPPDCGDPLLGQVPGPESELPVSNTTGVKTEEATTLEPVTDAEVTTLPCTDPGAADEAERELECWLQKIHCFFTEVLFPAFEHNLLIKKEVQEERIRMTEKNRIALEKAKEKARLRQQQEAEEESKLRVKEEEENGNVPDDNLNPSPTILVTPVASTTSVSLKPSPTSAKRTKKK